jgi:AmmeMemoRadiSam system protein A/AmmeMemoRadiSam system protein B
VPHPPIIVPEIGGGREEETSATIKAMEKLTKELSQKHPDSLFVISPHGVSHYDAMGVATAKSLKGSLRNWGAISVDYDFANDMEAVALLREEAKASNIPLQSIGERSYDLDHGVMVPMSFLIKGVREVPLVPLTFSWLPLSTHFEYGKVLRRVADKLEKRVAIIASGDLSHRLLPGAPAGYEPMGKVFDTKLVDAIASYDVDAILNLDPDLIERAGECGLRSIIILLGALDGLRVKSEVLSYEGPFGVGYMVASFDVENMHPLVKLAKETVETYIREGKVPKPETLTPEMRERAGVFVSLRKRGALRGCIGTFEPTRDSVAEELISNAISSATRDPRFLPIAPEELPDISYSVDILTKPEPVASPQDLDPKRYGVIVECGGRRGLLLPDLEGVDTVEHQIEICRAKAGIFSNEPVTLYRFQVRRYK